MKPSDLFHSVQDFRHEQILRKIKKKVERECRRLSYSFNVADQQHVLNEILYSLSIHTTHLKPYNLNLSCLPRRKITWGYLFLLPKCLHPSLDTLDFSQYQKIQKCTLAKYFAGKMTYRKLRKHMTTYSIVNNIEVSFSVMDQFEAADFIHAMNDVTPNTGVVLPYIKKGKMPVMSKGFDIQGFEVSQAGTALKLQYQPATLTLFK